jgi:phenylalanyl-tRNA synthetase beta chain
MKVSLNTLKFINKHYDSAGDPAPDGVAALVEKIGAQLGAVEEVTPFGKKYEDALIVRVVSCEQHPNADRLHVCKIDDGGKAAHVERDENGYVQVVCGAPNVHEGMTAIWLPPGATVPSTYYDIDSFVLEVRELRGVVSNGMLASPKELSLSDNHEGILEITDHPDEHGIPEPGTLFVDAYNLRGDEIIDMENKMFTHRPDCFGYLGIARDIEGISNRPYRSPAWYTLDPEMPGVEADELQLEVRNELPELVPRFCAITMRGVEVKPSPVWLQVELAKAGIRPINNIVDYTNFFMLETGQPLHAYDYDKVKERSDAGHAVITVRRAQEGEKITLLGGKEVAPTPGTIMIATDKQAVGIGGVMGGADTEVDESTKNIIIECANFDMYAIRRTSMALGLFTDAVTRFTKGQSPLQNLAALGKITDEIRRYAGGKVASAPIDDNHVPQDVRERGSVHPPVTLTRDFVNGRLGFDLSVEEMRTLLINVEFDVQQDGDTLTVTAPFWRTDIAIAEDVVEEIGRLYGYDHLPLDLPARDVMPAAKDPLLSLKTEIRNTLSRFGANEALTYSFVHGDLLDKTGQSRDQAFQIANALSPDLQYYRLSLTPSLLEKVHPNIKAGHDQFALFELGKVYNKSEAMGLDPEGLPRELNALACVCAANDKAAAVYSGAPYYQARKYLVNLLAEYHVLHYVRFELLSGADLYGNPWVEQVTAPYEPNRSAVLRDGKGLIWGVVGEFKPAVRRALKLPAFAAGFEFDPLLCAQQTQQQQYVQLPRFPKVEQDICLKVPANLPYGELFRFVWDRLDEKRPAQTYHSLEPVDIYQREDDQAHKQITLRLQIASYERTLTDEEVNALLDRVAEAAHEQFGAERV